MSIKSHKLYRKLFCHEGFLGYINRDHMKQGGDKAPEPDIDLPDDDEEDKLSVGFHPEPKPSSAKRESFYYPPAARDSGIGHVNSENLTLIQLDQAQPQQHQQAERGKRNCCVTVFLAIFATRQLAGKHDRELYVKYLVRELVIYLIYLIILALLTFGVTNANTFYFTRVFFDLFINKNFNNSKVTFRTSANLMDFWTFQRDILPDVYWDETSDMQDLLDKHELESQGIFYENQLMGVPRLRQLRVKSGRCIADNGKYDFVQPECFPSYSEKLEDIGEENRTTWTAGIIPMAIRDAWIHKTEDQLNDSSSHLGRWATYSGAGAVQNLEKTYAGSDQIVNQLQQNIWVTNATRAVFLDFTVYNSNINLFCVVRLVWEFSPTAALTTSWSFRTVRLIRYLTSYDNDVVFPCEILFCVFTLYYLVQELVEMWHLGCCDYFTDFWSYLDWAILAISGICIAFSFRRYDLVEYQLANLVADENVFHDFEFLGYWQTQFNHAAAVAVFFSLIKVFKYTAFNRTMTQVSSTLSRCAKDIAGFAIMFFIIFLAFAQLGYLLFGSQLEDFSTFADSIFTLLRLILGDFDYAELKAAHRVFGPIFFICYVFFVFFVLLNMFLAIINDTYGEVKAEIQSQRSEFQIADYFKRVFSRRGGVYAKGRAKASRAQKVVDPDGDKQLISYEELRQNLLDEHYSGVEIEMFMARYELDQDRALDEEETQKVLAELERDKTLHEILTSSKGNPLLQDEEAIAQQEALYVEEFSDLQERVSLFETSIVSLQHVVNEMATKLGENHIHQ